MKFGVVVFPGTWSDRDCFFVLKNVLGQQASYIWHRETGVSDCDCLILPGGFSYGDYLRAGAIARFSPIIKVVERFALEGKLVLGICNGFQILCEAGLLPGVLLINSHLQYRCSWTHLRVENNLTPFTRKCIKGQILKIPISHYQGCYYADPGTLKELEENKQVVLRYCSPTGQLGDEFNPNGSINHIAGICNKEGNVLGMMPHPERACEEILGSGDGRLIFSSIISALDE